MQSALSSKSFGAPDGPIHAERAGFRPKLGDQKLQNLDFADQALLRLLGQHLRLAAAQKVVPPESAPDGALQRLRFGLGQFPRSHHVAAERLEQLHLGVVLQPYVEDRAARQGLETDFKVL